MGYTVATTVLSRAASQDLTDLATVKDELSIMKSNTGNDAWISRAIRQISQLIATHTNRVFNPEVVQDCFDLQQDAYPFQTPGGFAQLQLSRWPVLAVLSVTQALTLTDAEPLIEGKHYRIDLDTGLMLRLNPYTGGGSIWEAAPITVVYVAGVGQSVAEAEIIPDQAPYQVTVAQAAEFSCDQTVVDSEGGALTRVNGMPVARQYSVANGIYTFAADDAGQSVSIFYAIAQPPFDLVDVCLRMVTGRYKAKDRDPTLVQRDTPGVGTERFWFGGAPGQKGPFPPDLAGIIEPYRMPVVI